MQLITHTKIEKCCEKNSSRFALEHVYYDGENIIATNGKIIAVNPVNGSDKDTPGIIPPEVIAEARKAKNLGVVNCHVKFHFPASTMEYKRPDSSVSFPKWEQVIESPEGKIAIALDADLLKNLSEALCTARTRGVKLFIDPKNPLAPIRVEPYNKNGNFGTLMPLRIREEE